ncbi:unnamed protein product, partial [Ectocarpus sp. 13 AM-2016]
VDLPFHQACTQQACVRKSCVVGRLCTNCLRTLPVMAFSTTLAPRSSSMLVSDIRAMLFISLDLHGISFRCTHIHSSQCTAVCCPVSLHPTTKTNSCGWYFYTLLFPKSVMCCMAVYKFSGASY